MLILDWKCMVTWVKCRWSVMGDNELTFISSRFGGRDAGLVPAKAEPWWLWLPWIETEAEGAASGRGGEEAVVEVEDEDEDGCWFFWSLSGGKAKGGKGDISSSVLSITLNSTWFRDKAHIKALKPHRAGSGYFYGCLMFRVTHLAGAGRMAW